MRPLTKLVPQAAHTDTNVIERVGRAAATAAIAVTEVSRAVGMRGVEAPTVDKTFVAFAENDERRDFLQPYHSSL
jgi:hypothetical protein